MKTSGKIKISRIIFIGYFSLIILILSSFLIPAKKDGNSESKEFSVNLSSVKYLKISNGCHIRIVSGEKDSLSLFTDGTNINLKEYFKIEGDTLIVNQSPKPENHHYFQFNLKVKELRKIEADNGSCNLAFNADSIELEGRNNSMFDIEYRNKFKSIRLNLKKSSFTSGRHFIDKLGISMQDSSSVQINGVNDLQMTSDSTSRFYSY